MRGYGLSRDWVRKKKSWDADAVSGVKGSQSGSEFELKFSAEPVIPEHTEKLQPRPPPALPLPVRHKDIVEFVCNPGCRGCRATLRCSRQQAHDDMWRKRIMDEPMKKKGKEPVERKKGMRLDIRILVDVDTSASHSKMSATGNDDVQRHRRVRTTAATAQRWRHQSLSKDARISPMEAVRHQRQDQEFNDSVNQAMYAATPWLEVLNLSTVTHARPQQERRNASLPTEDDNSSVMIHVDVHRPYFYLTRTSRCQKRMKQKKATCAGSGSKQCMGPDSQHQHGRQR